MDGTRARALLGVSSHATPDELRQAFRRQALSTHPDRGGDAARFDETVVAFRALSASAPLVAVPTVSASADHESFDAYDSSIAATPQHDDRPTFALVLERIAAQSTVAA
ncbi:MAG TPA: J domain-containing protein [Acidimicrobiia bacterium]|jgi:hypothetical protein